MHCAPGSKIQFHNMSCSVHARARPLSLCSAIGMCMSCELFGGDLSHPDSAAE